MSETQGAAAEEAVIIGPYALEGMLTVPDDARAVVAFAHGSGSSRRSPRNRAVARALNEAGLATLLFDLLTPEEAADRANVFNIGLLADRLLTAIDDLKARPETKNLPIGLFGASTGAAAALVAAARRPGDIAAVVSRGGRADMAGDDLPQVRAPTLLIVGGDDAPVVAMNREARGRLAGPSALEIIPGATHLFEEPGALEAVARLAADWFRNRAQPSRPKPFGVVFRDRDDAGRRLAAEVAECTYRDPVVYALPRGGAPVAARVAEALDAPLDLVLVRKLGAPFQPELAMGAVVDGGETETVLNEQIVEAAGISRAEIDRVREREEVEIERRRKLYFRDRKRPDVKGRDAIVVDDGLATGATALAAIRALKRRGAARVVLAVPVAPPDTVERLAGEADAVICLEQPEPFFAIGGWYADFRQLSDGDVVDILDAAAKRAGGG
ncbi:phosphoribosyltransferase family protein [Marinicauda salina]|uniref:phosphoribosyltransferase family protein n=1 Tax=Marinicauda salina TaxID=2135793 RepID=UPI001E505449|nr:phosphoribosyltransferase family protein [Marinicauda salina]